MKLWVRLSRRSAALVLGLALGGCLPPAHTQLDEEKEPHFLEGKHMVNALDYSRAIECFEKAIAVNPRSAAAHFEAGLLYEKNQQDYAAAIYHFERFLDLRPRSDYAEVVKQRILACKQELARTISLGPVTASLQREFEQLAEENKRLHEEVERWRVYAAHLQTLTNAIAATAPAAWTRPAQAVAPVQRSEQPALPVTNPGAQGGRTHTIKPGETPAAIARKYGFRVVALMAANPGLDARRLRIGQSLNLPLQQLARD